MMNALSSVAVQGLDGIIVRVEVDAHKAQQPSISIIGLWDMATQEARDRLKPAIKNSGLPFPVGKKITANLAPADLKKKGPCFDLAIAVGIVSLEIDLSSELLKESVYIGELALDGQLRGVNGILPSVLCAKAHGFKRVILPRENAAEGWLVEGIDIIGAGSLEEVIGYLRWSSLLPVYAGKPWDQHVPSSEDGRVDLRDIVGQSHAKRALIIAAAGGHNILLQWPPWSGKTMLAHAFAGLLPPLTFDEMIAVTRIYSVAGLLSKARPMVRDRPFRKVHHTASVMSIVGGGRDARPGEISLAHKGVLFMDEFLEFDGRLLETLRQPIEDGEITVNRVHGSYTYPAKFILIGAYNPTPCGYPESDPQCTDSRSEIERYRGKLSGPILDRIDLHVSVPRVKIEDFSAFSPPSITSHEARSMVLAARALQQARLQEYGASMNSEMSNPLIDRFCALADTEKNFLQSAVKRLDLSTRAYFRILRLARTIADLAQSPDITLQHLAEALSYREG